MRAFPTAPAWYRPVLAAEGSILRLVLPRLRESDQIERDDSANYSLHPDMDHGVAERLVPQAERGGDRHMPHHAARYAWALRTCEGKRVVDLGCGAGYGTVILSSFAQSVVGIDVSPEAIQTAKRLYPAIDFRVGDLITGELPAADVGVCFEVVEHLDRPETALERYFDAYPRLLLSLPNPLAGGSHINPHHRVDWPLVTLKRKLREAGARELTVYRQGYFSPAISRRRIGPAVTWVIDASREPAS